ncbi:MAG: alpha/beta hydrolase [Cyanobacteria bacterium REEB446]|nr:alpha/beta hydrolase [Cyanobacteria bacterium REEB446]
MSRMLFYPFACLLFILGLIAFPLDAFASIEPSFVVETPFINHNIDTLKQNSSINFRIKRRNQALDRIFLKSNHPELIPERFISLGKNIVEVNVDISGLDISNIDDLRITLIDPKTAYKNERDLFWGEFGKFFSSSCKADLKKLNLLEPDDIVCGDVIVPENRSVLGTRGIVIHTAKLIGTKPELAPVVILEGGPGGEFDIAGYLGFVKEGFSAGRSIIMIDQRGVGASSPIPECFPPVENKDYVQAQACIDKWSSKLDLSSYNTQENADDVADIVRAYDYDKAVIFGASYGSRLGLELMRRHSQIIEASLLSAIALPGDSYILDINKSISDSLLNVLNLCKADKECDSTYPDLENELNRVLKPGNKLSKQLWTEIFEMLYAKSSVEIIPKAIYKAKNNKLKSNSSGKRDKEGLMYFSTVCSDNYSLDDFERAESDQLTIPLEWQKFLKLTSFDDLCKYVPYKNLGNDYYKAINSQTPTLIVQGVLDHVTPLEDARKLNSQLSNSRLIEFPQGFHSVTVDNDCGLKIVQDFFTNLQKDTIDASCANDTKLEFVTPKSKPKPLNRDREYSRLIKRF